MAPEQFGGASGDVSPATDVHGLGVILYELLTGRPPYQAATAAELILQIESQPPAPLRRLRPEVPARLEAICLKCLEKNPTRRFPRAQPLADDLRRFLRETERPSVVWKRWVPRWWRGPGV
jgi:serine/threonine protein kinase